MKRFGQVIGIRKECLDEYRRIHVKLWPEIEAAIREAGIRNYSIFHFDTHQDGLLFASFEYHGPDTEFDARMARLAAAPRMREWWNLTEPMQIPLPGRKPGAWWLDLEEVFHLE